jgi:hypothetical protein
MSGEHSTFPENCLGYSYNLGGLNNQKLALFGLFLKAYREGPRRIILPDLLVYDIASFKHVPIPIGRALQVGPLQEFATKYLIEILDIPACGDKGGGGYFHYGNNYLPCAALLDELSPDSFTCEFFRSLVPTMRGSELFRQVSDATFERGHVGLVVQLRIESDWVHHTALRLTPTVGRTEHNLPSFRDIMAKLSNTLPRDASGIYVVCDEAALPVDKEEIRRVVKQDFDLSLVWKSDFLSDDQLSNLSPLDLSILDFEMALTAESFVGMTRSTFSNMVSFEKYARTRAPVQNHYVYNGLGPRLALRTDNGAFSFPDLAAAADPRASSYGFSRAQIFHSWGDLERALENYTAWAEHDGAESDERFISLYRAAEIQGHLGFAPADVIDTYARATEVCPSRAEALHGASRYCGGNKMFQQGFELAQRGLQIPVPQNALFLERWIYEYGLLDELAINGYWAGRYWECADACLKILKDDKVPANQRSRIIANAQFALGYLRPPSLKM